MNQKKVYTLLLLLGLAWFARSVYAAEVYSDRIAAVVNGDVILESDIKKHKQPFMRNLTNLPLGVIPPGKWPTEREILDELVVIHLLEQEASKKGVKVEDKGVDASVEGIKKRNNLTQDQFVLLLAANGLNYSEYRKIMKRQLTLTRLIATEVTQKVPLSEEDAQLYFKKNRENIDELYKKMLESLTPSRPPQEETKPQIPTHEEVYVGGKLRLRQITLKMPDKNRKSAEKAMERARQIYREAMTGADFAQLAKKYSQDPLASKGGDLGVMDYKDMVPAMQKVVQRLKPGDVSPPMGTQDSLIMFYLADGKGRKLQKIPIPEKIRKELEKRWQESQAQRQATGPQPSQKGSDVGDEEDDPEKKEPEAPTSKPKKASEVLTPAEEKEYRKVRGKVADLLRNETIVTRMKEYIEELKKSSIIEVKL
jgi:peptidyl-prolyl cis-trans isomerase SurA